ncbi:MULTISPECIES: HWE histidine kinase domain-containing protein [unclassified Beijerinckia]|uniref:HWE histidine kinase domain-containing protein n=1 Tax=unclassified Beijerinckia TaxID=2638183 RepID=UPI00147CEDD6|nr:MULTISPECIES: HWE histidine kinase domain-containing protein [unclassified Beijerinckia]MDH7799544.1 two-component sensor histidine kinase [Beijerinckia sp. GAS462]
MPDEQCFELDEIIITGELARRDRPDRNYQRENLALHDLSRQMAHNPQQLLPHLVEQALDLCSADSAGISVLDGPVFRWTALHGKLEVFDGETTPRHDSPCGVCLDQEGALLMRNPERVYDWIRKANITVPEVLLVPLPIDGGQSLGTLWVVAKEGDEFNAGHMETLTHLAAFAGTALRMLKADEKLKQALEEQETLTREMNHRISNIFAINNSILGLSARLAESKDDLVEVLRGRFGALADAHGLVRRSFHPSIKPQGVDLAQLVEKILKPYFVPTLKGQSIQLGENTTNSMALMLHELATNAVKYGALSVEGGELHIDWKCKDDQLILNWQEDRGPTVVQPTRSGFGSKLIANTLRSLQGTINYDWSAEGLRAQLIVPLKNLER